MSNYPIPMGEDIPTVSDVTVKAHGYGWLIRAIVSCADGRALHIAAIVETQGALQKSEFWQSCINEALEFSTAK